MSMVLIPADHGAGSMRDEDSKPNLMPHIGLAGLVIWMAFERMLRMNLRRLHSDGLYSDGYHLTVASGGAG